ncbi:MULTISPECIES: RNA polymerase sigma factor [Thalassospira]|jgi:RNA polymerase sigma-70 factor (ECF subfamily)|uniref:RNA polymerase sigma factor n=3 Tax=Thalassospira TaxID=168934 RepID=A0A358HYS1_9PROT|nr:MULTISPECIES: RNA polymerase sigma factor [Thalassospira]PKR58841.1 fec I [Thalassospira lohafexi]HBV00143.1 RNA polymerase sigma factor [Thalassospira lucentensis]HCW66139.1 RNA polymerase sigma factor [Thalassospira lucentensis]|tara:strand:+ start:76 stop:624 length:549 start_codon:yes stop_codon:yes gene_type:complete
MLRDFCGCWSIPKVQTVTHWDVNNLFRTYRGRLLHFVRQRRISWHLADDIVQDTFVRVVATPSLPEQCFAQSYLYRTANNLVIDHFRRERILTFVQDSELAFEVIADDAPSPEQIAWSRQELRHLQKVLESLPRPLRDVFILARVEGKTYVQIGEQLGIPTQTAFSRMVKALGVVKEAMEKP